MNISKDLKIKKRINETSDSVSFVLDIPENMSSEFKYEPGQFVTLVMNVSGEEIRRSYSIASCPTCDSDFKITIKRVTGGKGSNYLLDQCNEGDTLQVTPPAGLFTLPSNKNMAQFVFVAGGSGITPIISLIKKALCSTDKKVMLLYANRDEENIIFKNELDKILQENQKRFSVVHSLSSKDGRLNTQKIKALFDENDPNGLADYFLCGPEGLMACTEEALALKELPKSAIHKESFGTAPDNAATATEASAEDYYDLGPEAVVIGDKGPTEKSQKIEVSLNGEQITLNCENEDTILEALINAGHNPPYSCMDGACMACLAKVTEGRVYQDEPGILTDENVEDRECLTCQARAASPCVKIDYDAI